MIWINDDSDDDKQENIYTDFDFKHLQSTTSNDSEQATVKQSPVASMVIKQQSFENQVRAAVETIVQESMVEKYPYFKLVEAIAVMENDIRPRVLEEINGNWILVDSGSAVTAWPKTEYPEAILDQTCSLQAVNKSSIKTYGTTVRHIQIGGKSYQKEVIIADIPKPIIGWDFVRQHKLDFIWDHATEEIYLCDQITSMRTKMRMDGEKMDLRVESVTPESSAQIVFTMVTNTNATGKPKSSSRNHTSEVYGSHKQTSRHPQNHKLQVRCD